MISSLNAIKKISAMLLLSSESVAHERVHEFMWMCNRVWMVACGGLSVCLRARSMRTGVCGRELVCLCMRIVLGIIGRPCAL